MLSSCCLPRTTSPASGMLLMLVNLLPITTATSNGFTTPDYMLSRENAMEFVW